MTKPTIPPKYTVQQLQQFLQLSSHFMGDIEQVIVKADVIKWYKEQQKQIAKNFNIPTTKNHKDIMFMGIKLNDKA